MIKSLFFVASVLLLLSALVILSCRKDLLRTNNKPPVAHAGNDATIILPVDSVKLDGRASKDPDGSIKEFLWSKISGPSDYTFTESQSSTSVLRNLAHGIYQIELKVTDEEGLSGKDTLLIMVDSALVDNHPPISKAGNDTAIVLPVDSVTLDGSGSFDAEGPIKEYLWSKISGPSSFQFTDAGSVITVIKNLTKGIYQLELKVTDSEDLSSRDTVLILVDTINSSNRRPVANAGPDQLLHEDPEVLFDGGYALLDGTQSADPDSNIVSYRWSQIAGASAPISNSDTVQTYATIYQYDSYQFELKVTDSQGLSDLDTVAITVAITDTANRPPIAYAGEDVVIYLPANNVTLNGSMSSDPNNNITAYQWTKVSGPSSFNVTNSNAVQTEVTLLTEGIYLFELKVTDATSLSSTDAVQVKVITCGAGDRPSIQVKAVSVGSLSNPGYGVAVASVANKIVFAGGASTVDIYDMTTHTWSRAQLGEARTGITAIAAGNKIFFAGGESGEIGDVTQKLHSTVDIYDASTNTWSVTSLSSAGSGIAAVFAGNKVFFSGGTREIKIANGTTWGASNTVDIYDLSANSWSAFQLSEARAGISVVALNNKVYFAGGDGSPGYSNKIDIYDHVSNSWTSTSLSEGKMIAGGGIAAGNKIYWAGGYNGSEEICKVEIMDQQSQNVSIEYLSKPGVVKAVLSNNKILFFRYDKTFDIYDINAKTWSIGVLPAVVGSVISTDNGIYITGGSDNPSAVWKLDF